MPSHLLLLYVILLPRSRICLIPEKMQISLSSHGFVYITFYFMLGRCTFRRGQVTWGLRLFIFSSVYCNSLLATLNASHLIKNIEQNNTGIQLHCASGPDTPSSGNLLGHLWPKPKPGQKPEKIEIQVRHSTSQHPLPSPGSQGQKLELI